MTDRATDKSGINFSDDPAHYGWTHANTDAVFDDRAAAAADFAKSQGAVTDRGALEALITTEAAQTAVRDAIAETLGDAMDCTRVWEAWQVGTMTQDDFCEVADDEARLMEITNAALAALLSQAQEGA